MHLKGLFAVGAALFCMVLVPVAQGQSFNLDMNTSAVHPAAGVPTDAFGAAANSPGRWNAITGNVQTAFPSLLGLDGVATGVNFTRSSAVGGNFAFNNANTTGDFELLLDDGHDLSGVTAGISFVFSNLQPGPYDVYTYAVAPDASSDITVVTVTGASPPNPQNSGGVIPFNAFAQGITHTRHEVIVAADGLLTIHANGATPSDFGTVNGIQLFLVPEPATLSLLALAPVMLFRRRRQ